MINILAIFIIGYIAINEYEKKIKNDLLEKLIKEAMEIEEYIVKYNILLKEKESKTIENIEEFNKEIDIFNKEVQNLKIGVKKSKKIFYEIFPQELYKELLKINDIEIIELKKI